MSNPNRTRLAPATPDQIPVIGPCVLIERGPVGAARPVPDNRIGWELFRWQLHQDPDKYRDGTARLVLLGPGEANGAA